MECSFMLKDDGSGNLFFGCDPLASIFSDGLHFSGARECADHGGLVIGEKYEKIEKISEHFQKTRGKRNEGKIVIFMARERGCTR